MAGAFCTDAPALWKHGWRNLIPIKPRSKVPAIANWQVLTETPQSVGQFHSLLRTYAGTRPGSGTGHVTGAGLELVDIDILDVKAAERAAAIVEEVAGSTPLLRVGLPPKTVLVYQGTNKGKINNPQHLAIELYCGGTGARGQVVLFGTHDSGQSYTWTREDPRTMPVAELPCLSDQARSNIINALAADPLVLERGRVRDKDPGEGGGGAAGTWLAEAQQHLDDLPSWLASVHPGGRHYACTAALVLTYRMGLDPRDQDELVEALEVAFLLAKPEGKAEFWRIARWARQNTSRPRTVSETRRRLGLGPIGREVRYG